MTLLLLVLMGFHLHGEIVHEWAGIIFTLLIMLHLYLNRHRLWSLSPNIPLTMLVVNRIINAVTFVVILTAIVSGMMLSRHILLDQAFHNPASWVRKVHMTSGPLGNAHSGAAYRVALENAGDFFLPGPEHLQQFILCKCHDARSFFANRSTGIVRITEPGLSRLFVDKGRFLLFRLR